MSHSTSLKQRLGRGEQLTGCFISLFNPLATEIVANTGYDIALIDMEHGPGSHMDAIGCLQAIKSTSCSGVIRTSSSNIVEIKRTMDIGPAGIMVPNITSVAEAKSVIKHCRYAPSGDRGAAPGFMRATGYSKNLNDYPRFLEEDFLLILQIESPEAIEELEDIVALDGFDMIFIGPADLSAKLGKLGDFTSTKFISAFTTIEQQVVRSQKSLGCITFNQWDAKKLYNNGHQLVISNSDALLLEKAAQNDLQSLSS